ncbi:MAG: MBL fold metallo-hydrolase [Methanomassiliicoccales archaeon]
MKIKFLGGADVVGRMGMLLENKGAQLIFEYGMRPSNPPSYPLASPPVDFGFLTHCHLDHSGMIPWLAGRYDTEVVATPSTISVVDLLLHDSLKVADLEGFPRPFEEEDIKAAMRNFIPMDYGNTIDVGGFEVEIHSAGHVPGSAMYEMRGDKTTVFTGDLNTTNTHLVWGAHPVKCDNLVVEATYAGRTQPERKKTENEFLDKVREVVERGGTCVCACFAVGRTQEVMLMLKNLKYNMWVDGMGKTVNRLYLDHPEYLRSAKDLRRAKKRFKEVRSRSAREAAKKEGEVIVTTGGMLDGGPVISYIQAIKDDPKSAVLLTGFQVDESNGRNLLDNGVLEIQGVDEKVKCEIQKFDFSAHSDHNELLHFVKACDPEKVILCHSDDRQALADDLGDYEVVIPEVDRWYEL